MIYSSILPEEADASRGVGRSWKSFFNRTTKEETEKRMAELGYKGEWDNENRLHLHSPILPAIRTTSYNTPVFFNQMIAQYLANGMEFKYSNTVHEDEFLVYGDGTSVDGDALRYANEMSDKYGVTIQWQAGDIALIDNLLVMHARRLYQGTRKVYASLVL